VKDGRHPGHGAAQRGRHAEIAFDHLDGKIATARAVRSARASTRTVAPVLEELAHDFAAHEARPPRSRGRQAHAAPTTCSSSRATRATRPATVLRAAASHGRGASRRQGAPGRASAAGSRVRLARGRRRRRARRDRREPASVAAVRDASHDRDADPARARPRHDDGRLMSTAAARLHPEPRFRSRALHHLGHGQQVAGTSEAGRASVAWRFRRGLTMASGTTRSPVASEWAPAAPHAPADTRTSGDPQAVIRSSSGSPARRRRRSRGAAR